MKSKHGNITMKEICNECGHSVKMGSGRCINRIPSGDDYKTHVDMGKQFPEGEFMCRQCEINEYGYDDDEDD